MQVRPRFPVDDVVDGLVGYAGGSLCVLVGERSAGFIEPDGDRCGQLDLGWSVVREVVGPRPSGHLIGGSWPRFLFRHGLDGTPRNSRSDRWPSPGRGRLTPALP